MRTFVYCIFDEGFMFGYCKTVSQLMQLLHKYTVCSFYKNWCCRHCYLCHPFSQIHK